MRKQTELSKLNDKKFAKYIQTLNQDSFRQEFLEPVKEEEKGHSVGNLNRLQSFLKSIYLGKHLRNQVVEYLINILDENTLIRLFKSGQGGVIAKDFFENYHDQPSMLTLINTISPQGLLNICEIEIPGSTVAHLLLNGNPLWFLAMKKKLDLNDLSQTC